MVDFNNDEDQASNSEEVEWEDNGIGIGGSTDYSEVENDSSDSSINHTSKYIKQNQKRSSELLLMKKLMTEVKAASLTTVVSLKHL
jgi:hypothetical protein